MLGMRLKLATHPSRSYQTRKRNSIMAMCEKWLSCMHKTLYYNRYFGITIVFNNFAEATKCSLCKKFQYCLSYKTNKDRNLIENE